MRIALGLALLGAACIYACGGSSGSSKGGSAGADIGAAGDSSSNGGSAGKSSGSAGNGTIIGDAGAGGEGGEGGSAPPVVVVSTAKPHAAGGLVAGGVIAHSKHFTGVFSLGAAPGGNRILTSTSYQMRGGVLGASQK
jgi:hypothetical protein